MTDLAEQIARNLYLGFPDTRLTPVEIKGQAATLWHGVSWEQAQEDRRQHFREQAAAFLSGDTAGVIDPALLAAYQRTTGEPGDPEADALAAEIERRGLDV